MYYLIITLLTHGGLNGGYWGVVKEIEFSQEATCHTAAIEYKRKNPIGRGGADFVSAICVKK